RLNKGHKPSNSCLLTMSLGMPYKPPDWEEDEPPVCWKLISGVIEL
ncbi:MAG: dual OB domain-containing protein, partial [Planctomycetota bacterium]